MFRWQLTAALMLSLSPLVWAGQDIVPRFEPGPCAIEVPKDEIPLCGNLIVREDRRSTNDRTIRLPIIILKSTNVDPKPDPVLRTLGGPGGSSLRLARGRRSSPWLADRDYIIFEQRGTKYSQPALECPEVDTAIVKSAESNLDRKTARRSEVKAAKACHDRLMKKGIDLSAYNSTESAADIEDLRRVLKLEKINLYGVSYSARLMLNVMRMFPDGIRSVVLESTLPPEANYDEVGVDAIVRTFDQMFAACRLDDECASAYPDLEKKFYEVVKALNSKPLQASVPGSKPSIEILLDGHDFVTWIADYFFSNEPSATITVPYVIGLASRGNFDAFRRYASEKVGPAPYSWGMRYSVWCSEEKPFENSRMIRSQSIKHAGLKGYEVMALPEICSVWKVRSAPSIENHPVSSDIPTLIFGAEYDAYTPPEWGRTTSRHLKNSYYFEVPWAGHGPGFSVPCVAGMIADFFKDPHTSPAADCIQKTKSQFRFLVKKP